MSAWILFHRGPLILALASLAACGSTNHAHAAPRDSGTDAEVDAGVEGSGDDTDDAAAPTDDGATLPPNDGTSPFLGSWTLAGTQRTTCGIAVSRQSTSTAVSFRTNGGAPGSLLFDPGLSCSLVVTVEGGLARLAPTPQRCAESDGSTRIFTSVVVEPQGGGFSVEQTATTASGCTVYTVGTLRR